MQGRKRHGENWRNELKRQTLISSREIAAKLKLRTPFQIASPLVLRVFEHGFGAVGNLQDPIDIADVELDRR